MSDKNRIDKYADGIVTTANEVELSPYHFLGFLRAVKFVRFSLHFILP